VLQSRDLTRAFINEHNLMPMLFADEWNSSEGGWKVDDPAKVPDIEDAVRYFSESIRTVEEAADTRLVTLAVEWTDPVNAANWANELVDLVNDQMRSRALRDAEANVRYLQSELSATSVVTLQQSIGRLLETEMQKLMLARGSEEFAFRVIDRAVPPQQRSKPRRTLTVVLATVLGGVIAGIIIVVRWSVTRDTKQEKKGS
jgi:uncharacterized protein involved in exopolysaccharide biosynthesis